MDNIMQNVEVPVDGEIAAVQKSSIIRTLMADDRMLAEVLATYEGALEVIGKFDDPELAEVIKVENGRLTENSVKALQDLICQVENPASEGKVPDSLCGIAGYQVLVFFKAFLTRFYGEGSELCIDDDGNIQPVFSDYRIKTSGKITDYLFMPGTKVSDVLWKGNKGHLSVNVVDQEFFTKEHLIDCTPTNTKLYHWDIELRNCDVHKRDDSTFEDTTLDPTGIERRFKPFPMVDLKFPEYSIDPDDGRSIWCRCLNHKIYAQGEGQIKVHNVFCCEEDGSIARLEDSHCFYKVTEASCVDLMFRGFPPKTQLPPQIEYCLGRCAHPPIVNTGGG